MITLRRDVAMMKLATVALYLALVGVIYAGLWMIEVSGVVP